MPAPYQALVAAFYLPFLPAALLTKLDPARSGGPVLPPSPWHFVDGSWYFQLGDRFYGAHGDGPYGVGVAVDERHAMIDLADL